MLPQDLLRLAKLVFNLNASEPNTFRQVGRFVREVAEFDVFVLVVEHQLEEWLEAEIRAGLFYCAALQLAEVNIA